MGLLACLTAALLAGIVVSRLDPPKAALDEVYLQTGVPTATPGHILVAPEVATTRMPPLGRVARPSAPRATGEPRTRPTPTATKSRDAIDGSGSQIPGGDANVGTASGDGRAAPPDDALPVSQLEAAAVALTNEERTRKGCAPLRLDPRLARAARAHSRDMAERGYFGHTSPDGASPWDRMARAGYSNSAAENIARGYASAEETVRSWMANSGHRRNILNCQIKTVGVGVAYGSGDIWWTQDFGYS
ncbi:CAP domain-containing protein [Sphaerisporangium album]|uniref:CAP domain-containing protein n=1 Tax=Sphaerisporangium album TaxID=509200 RepID=UPI0015F11DAD|nr:CAP domain-containing protein [Sphaerisporangium album]